MHWLAPILALALGQTEAPQRVPPDDASPPPVERPAAPEPPAIETAPEPALGPTGPPAPPSEPAPTEKPRKRRAPAAPPPAPPPTAVLAAPRPDQPIPERQQVARAAVRFFEALLGHRAGDLAGLCAPAFSFDGRSVSGQAEIRARFGELISRRDGIADPLGDLAVMPSAEALARYGKPPQRIASLAQPGAWVAVASLSGRATFVFFARHGQSWLATGMHD